MACPQWHCRAWERAWSNPVPAARTWLAREEPDQVLRLQAFRAAHPEVIIGDAGFGVWQARIPQPDGERIISRYALRELLDKLDKVAGEGTASGSAD